MFKDGGLRSQRGDRGRGGGNEKEVNLFPIQIARRKKKGQKKKKKALEFHPSGQKVEKSFLEEGEQHNFRVLTSSLLPSFL